MKFCPFCKTPIDFTIGRTTTCPSCKKELHCCTACAFYSPGSYRDCKENPQELVTDKTRGNFCDSFKLSDKPAQDSDSKAQDKAALARKKLEALFG